jgi:hypothetical protein
MAQRYYEVDVCIQVLADDADEAATAVWHLIGDTVDSDDDVQAWSIMDDVTDVTDDVSAYGRVSGEPR